MKYYAKVYTGNPVTGLISPGEMLTDKQVEQLGEEKILELCGRGVLGQMPGKEAEAPEKEPEIALETEEEPETEEELPELGNGEDLVSEAEPEPEKPAKKTTKSGNGRK